MTVLKELPVDARPDNGIVIIGFMDNSAYIQDQSPPSSQRKPEVRIPLQPRPGPAPSTGATTPGGGAGPSSGAVCRPEVCRRARAKYSQAQGSESPWHRDKTYYLIGTIVLLALWIVIYSVLSALDVV